MYASIAEWYIYASEQIYRYLAIKYDRISLICAH